MHDQRKFTEEEIAQLRWLVDQLRDSLANRRRWPSFDLNIEEQIKSIALFLFPICPHCGERHPPSDQMLIEEKAKRISEIIVNRFSSH